MPYRIDIPDGRLALDHLLNGVGTEALVSMRQSLIKTVYANHDTPLSHREREGMRILCTLIVGCPICNSLRLWRDHEDFCDEEIPEAFYENCMTKTYHWPGFTERERIVVEFSDRFCNAIDTLNGDDAFWDRVHAHFSEREIADICFFNSYFLGTGYTLKALGIGSVCEPIPASDGTDVRTLIARSHQH
jgi:alkylhydroperoxidase family enzyme